MHLRLTRDERIIRIPADGVSLEGNLRLPHTAKGVVVFAHGSGSSRYSPRTVYEIEVDPITDELEAFWVRTTVSFTYDMRIPAEWVERLDDDGVHVTARRSEIETGLGRLCLVSVPDQAA